MTIQANQLSTRFLHLDAPRYTSYPPANHFSGKFDVEIYKTWLNTADDDLSLYFHIPFCQKLCWFCGCKTSITSKYSPIRKYVDYLIREIGLVSAHLGGKRHVVNIHFGGGSPTLLSSDDLRLLFAVMHQHFLIKDSCEIAIEIDPRSVIEDKIKVYAELGFNRASIGVQDFDLQVQKAINREQSFEMTKEKIDLLRKYGIKEINIDLIYGLPYQTSASMAITLDKVMLLDPNRIALFSYAHVPWIKKHQRLIKEDALPTALKKMMIFYETKNYLESRDFTSIGIDHFARNDDALTKAYLSNKVRRNFQGYTSDPAQNLIGFGASAISSFSSGYAQNSPETAQYYQQIESGNLPITRGVTFSEEDIIRKTVIDLLMCYMEVDLHSVLKKFLKQEDYFINEYKILQQMLDHDIISFDNYVIKISDRYKIFTRLVAAVFDQYLEQNKLQYSRVV